jgi:hypothetical protein
VRHAPFSDPRAIRDAVGDVELTVRAEAGSFRAFVVFNTGGAAWEPAAPLRLPR